MADRTFQFPNKNRRDYDKDLALTERLDKISDKLDSIDEKLFKIGISGAKVDGRLDRWEAETLKHSGEIGELRQDTTAEIAELRAQVNRLELQLAGETSKRSGQEDVIVWAVRSLFAAFGAGVLWLMNHFFAGRH